MRSIRHTIQAREHGRKAQGVNHEGHPSASLRAGLGSRRKIHGAILCGDFGMGLSNVEAGILSREAGAEEISGTLRDAAQHSRGQLYVSTARQGNDDPEVAARYARALQIWSEGAPGDY